MQIDQLLTKQDLIDFEYRLYSKLNESQHQQKIPKYLRTKDLQEMFGLSPSTLQNLRNQGKLSFMKVGGTILYELKEIESLLMQSSK